MIFFKNKKEKKLKNMTDEQLDYKFEQFKRKSVRAMIYLPSAIVLSGVTYFVYPRPDVPAFPQEPELMQTQNTINEYISESQNMLSNLDEFTSFDSTEYKLHKSMIERLKMNKSAFYNDLELVVESLKKDSANIAESNEIKEYYDAIDLRKQAIQDNQETDMRLFFGASLFIVLTGAYSFSTKRKYDEINKEYQTRAKERAMLVPDKLEK